MKRTQIALSLIVVLSIVAGCSREEKLEPLPPAGSVAPLPRPDNFTVFPGSTARDEHTELLRKATRALNPQMQELPAMGTWVTDAGIEEVATFYATKYGHASIAPSDAPDTAGKKPAAYYSTGDLAEAAAVVRAALDKLALPSEVAAEGPYRSVHIDASPDLPRVSIQRPYIDPVGRTVVDKTLIQLVRE